MKTPTKQIIALLFAGLLCSVQAARSQLMELLGDCTEQVLSAPAENSVKLRLVGVNQWPVNPICIWNASGVRADGRTYTWQAVLIGDGLVGPPDSVDVSVQFRYTGPSGCSSIGVDFFPPYPSAPFTNHVTSEGAYRDPLCGQDGPPLSFQGILSLDASNNLTVDITFTGGTLPPTAISDLIALLGGSSLSTRQKRPLLATLEAARGSFESGSCETGIAQLHAFQNKVAAQVRGSDAVLAEALTAAAQTIIETACNLVTK